MESKIVTIFNSFGEERRVDTSKYDHVLFTDCDHTLSDGIYYFDSGLTARKFNLRDGHGFQLLKEARILPIILSGSNDLNQLHRADHLGVPFVGGVQDKLDEALSLLMELGIKGKTAFIGDDVSDIGLLNYVDFAGCPHDAHPDVSAEMISREEGDTWMYAQKNGGHGAFRSFAQYFIKFIAGTYENWYQR